MTVAEAAAYLKVNRNTIYRWCESGRLRYFELETGGGRRFRVEDLDALLWPSGEYWLVWVRLRGVPAAEGAQPPASVNPDFDQMDVERLRTALPRRAGPLGMPPPPQPWVVSAELVGSEIEVLFAADHEVTSEELADLVAGALKPPHTPGRLDRVKVRGPLRTQAQTGGDSHPI